MHHVNKQRKMAEKDNKDVVRREPHRPRDTINTSNALQLFSGPGNKEHHAVPCQDQSQNEQSHSTTVEPSLEPHPYPESFGPATQPSSITTAPDMAPVLNHTEQQVQNEEDYQGYLTENINSSTDHPRHIYYVINGILFHNILPISMGYDTESITSSPHPSEPSFVIGKYKSYNYLNKKS